MLGVFKPHGWGRADMQEVRSGPQVARARVVFGLGGALGPWIGGVTC